jgi:hypothetical protein
LGRREPICMNREPGQRPTGADPNGIYILGGRGRPRNFIEERLLIQAFETDTGTFMSSFDPLRVTLPYDFDIKCDRLGHWIVRDRGGLSGGRFRTCKDAMRFALFETDGDTSHVHLRLPAEAARNTDARPQAAPMMPRAAVTPTRGSLPQRLAGEPCAFGQGRKAVVSVRWGASC